MAEKRPGRKVGSEERLCSVTYGMIGRWVGLSPRTIGRYARRGDFDRRDLLSVLCWVNERRRRKGLSLIGAPDVESSEPIERIELQVPPNSGGYNPLTGDYDATT